MAREIAKAVFFDIKWPSKISNVTFLEKKCKMAEKNEKKFLRFQEQNGTNTTVYNFAITPF